MAMYFLSYILAIVRNRLLISVFFGEKRSQVDVYFAAFRIPDIIFQLLVVGALGAAFIPVFSGLLSQKREKRAWGVAANVISLGGLLFLLASCPAFIFARPLSKLVAPGFEPARLNLMASLVRILLFVQGFFVISAAFTGILQSHQRFLLPALAPVVYNLGIILGIVFLSSYFGIYGPALGAVAGAFFHFVIQAPLVFKLGFKPRLDLDFRNFYIKKIGRLMFPRTLSLAVAQLELTVPIILSSGMAVGRVAIFSLAQQLIFVPITLFGSSIGQAALPTLSSEVARERFESFKDIFTGSLNQILYLSVPASVLLLILRIPVVRLFYGARGFTWEDTIICGQTVALFALGIFAQAAIHLLVRSFYALEDTKTPLFLGIVAAAVNVGLSVGFTKVFNLQILGRASTFNSPVGLAFAASTSSILHVFLLFFWLQKSVGSFERVKFVLPQAKVFLSGFAMAVFLWAPMRILDRFILDTTRTINLLVLTVVVSTIGATVYFLLTWALKIKEAEILVELFSKLGGWKKELVKTPEVIDVKIDP